MYKFTTELVGKTIKEAKVFCGNLYIVFNDETYTWFEPVDEGYDGGQYITTGKEDNFHSYFVQLGIMTQEEFVERIQNNEKYRRLQQEKNELEILERLKKKYPSRVDEFIKGIK